MNDKKKNWKNPLPSNSGAQPKAGYTEPEYTRRCNKESCVTGRSENSEKVYAPLSELVITIRLAEGPNVPIGTVVRCQYCGTMYQVTLYDRAAETFGFTKHNLLKVLNASRMNTFHLHELQEGRLDPVKIPERMDRQIERLTVITGKGEQSNLKQDALL